ncbi:MAG: hypothetical protein D6689_20185 [Deltaproteobacteria bacterium]|nr:MAG: hypothetical protein D6689_20185 [Deltaproteobacteria bacterium]
MNCGNERGGRARWVAAGVAAWLVVAPGGARAGTFGGFSADGARYLDGGSRVCAPIAARVGSDEAPRCEQVDAAAVARRGFRRGRPQPHDGFRAAANGRTIEVYAPGSAEPIATWRAAGIVSRVVAVYAGDDGRVIAVEYETRAFGRTAREVIAFRLAPPASPRGEPAGAAPAPGDDRPPGGGRAAGEAPGSRSAAPATAGAGEAERRAGDVARAAREWARAERHYRAALAADPADVAARYGLAVALARRGRLDAALRELHTLARADRNRAGRFLALARTDPDLARLRKRRARAFDAALAAGDRPASAFDRLVAAGGRWERPFVTCQEAGVTLRLNPRRLTFVLDVVDECRGVTDRLRLDGTWEARGADALVLTFPNPGADDEVTECSVRACPDGSGEDCLTCQLDRDLGFTLRPVRRGGD